MFTRIAIAMTTALVLVTSCASAAPWDGAQHRAQAHSSVEKTWFSIPEGRDSM